MSAQGLLLNWIADLTDRLNDFQNQTSPLESQYQNTWETFQKLMNELLAPASGADAFSGEAAQAIRTAFSQCSTAEEGFQQANALGRAVHLCQTCVQNVDSAITSTSPRMAKLDLVEQVLESMTVDDIVKDGMLMVPQEPFDLYTLKHTILNPLEAIAPSPDEKAKELDAQEASQTQHALDDMANGIESAAATWSDGISALGGEHWPAEFLTQVSEDWGKTRVSLELAGKIKIGDFDLDGLGEFVEGKEPYLALISFLLQFASGKKFTPEAFFSDLYGAGLSLVPGVDVFVLYTEAVHDAAPLVGGLQSLAAGGIAGNDSLLRDELNQPGEGIKKGGEEIEPTAILTDLGGAIYNLAPSSVEGLPLPSYSLFHGGQRNIPAGSYDFQRATVDSLHLVEGTEKLAVDVPGALVDDTLGLFGNATHTSGATNKIVGGVNRVLGWLGG